jgi:hypothetical protein
MTGGYLSRRALMAATAAAMALSSPAFAQTGERVMETGRTPRKVVLPFVGAAIGGLASLVYFWGGPNTLPGACSKPACVGLVSLGSGALVGWLVGKEKDELHALRYRGGRALRPTTSSLTLTGEPVFLTVDDSVGAAFGVGGVQLFSTDARPRLISVRAPGLLNVTEAALSTSQDRFAITASGGLYRFPLATGQGVRLRPSPAATVTAAGTEYLVGSGIRVERVPADAPTESATWPGIALDDTVRALKGGGGGILWALTASSLYALRTAGDSFSVVSRTPLPSGARRLDVHGAMLAVALGDSGVRFLDIAEAAQPRIITDWRGTPFVYDVAIHDGSAYVAAGIDGLARITVGESPRLEGLARELGFIVAVTARSPDIWVLDRSGTAVVRKVRMEDLK